MLPPIYSNPFAVQVRATEFALQLSKANVSAGDVRVEFNLSRAEDPHNLWLVREDGTGASYSFDEEPSGAVAAETFALTRGRWKLFCSLHRPRGAPGCGDVDGRLANELRPGGEAVGAGRHTAARSSAAK